MQTRLIATAPMLALTNRHYRYLMRLITRYTWLYTEMITTQALLKGDRRRLLAYHPLEHPLAIQLGGADPKAMAQCAKMAEDAGYDEINLNIGCPSHKVQAGEFGACLMKKPTLVAQMVEAIAKQVRLPISIKTRIGLDDEISCERLIALIETASQAGCKIFIIHARNAWLTGLSPKKNRTVPPLRYEIVYQLKQKYPELTFVLNGGVDNLTQVQQHIERVDGVMLGREAYDNPYLFAHVDALFFNALKSIPSRRAVLEQYLPYVFSQLSQGESLNRLGKPLFGLYHATPGAKHWRRDLLNNLISSQGKFHKVAACA